MRPTHGHSSDAKTKKKRIKRSILLAGLGIALSANGIVHWKRSSQESNLEHDLADGLVKTTDPFQSKIKTERVAHREINDTTTRITVAVRLKGQIGNILSGVAYAMGLQLWLRDRYGMLNTSLVLLPDQKYVGARKKILQCFPNIRKVFGQQLQQQGTFKSSSSSSSSLSPYKNVHSEFKIQWDQQLQWLQSLEERSMLTGTVQQLMTRMEKLHGVRALNGTGVLMNYVNSTDDIDDGLDAFMEIVDLYKIHHETIDKEVDSRSIIQIPLLLSKSLQFFVMMDRYYDELISYFQFDQTPKSNCCFEVPQPNESVFHFRNYKTELGFSDDTTNLEYGGCQELPPRRVAYELFGHLQSDQNKTDDIDNKIQTTSNHRVAMTSRYPSSTETLEYVRQLQDGRGIPTRVVTNQSAVQDLCFLQHAQRELVGIASSTYVKWAAILGNATISRLYVYDTPLTEKKFGHGMNYRRLTYRWTNSHLNSRILFPQYKSA